MTEDIEMTLSLVEEVVVWLQRGEDPEAFAKDLAAFLKNPSLWRKEPSPTTDDGSFASRFVAAIAYCNFFQLTRSFTLQNFPENVFGEVGEGHVLAQPTATEKGFWTEEEINSWLAGPEVFGEGLEAAFLADGLDFVAKNQESHRDGPIIFWASVSSNGRVACLYRNGSARCLDADRRDILWRGHFRFLLRKIRKS